MSLVEYPRPFCFEFTNGCYLQLKPPHCSSGRIWFYEPKLESSVEWGDFITVQSGLERPTVIGEGTKLDSHVHIGHDSIIGRHVRICAGAIIGGFVEIGDYATIYIGALIHPRVKIGERATVGMGAVVLHDIPAGETWVGNPARKLR